MLHQLGDARARARGDGENVVADVELRRSRERRGDLGRLQAVGLVDGHGDRSRTRAEHFRDEAIARPWLLVGCKHH